MDNKKTKKIKMITSEINHLKKKLIHLRNERDKALIKIEGYIKILSKYLEKSV